jgi:FtsH-binding integral membrane protein
MNYKQKIAIISTSALILYFILSYILFYYDTDSILSVILLLPLSFGFIVGYALGDIIGYIFMVFEVALIWYLIYITLNNLLKRSKLNT